MRVIKKRPGELAELIEIQNTTANLQAQVGGCIEMVTFAKGCAIICDKEGCLRGKQYNCNLVGVYFVGTILIVGVDGDEFCDVPEYALQIFMMACKSCKHFIGLGDFALCCDIKYDLCYADTAACEKFEVKEKALTEVATSIVSTQSNNQVQSTPESGQCQDSVWDLLNEMIRLRKEFRRIYSNSGLVSVEGSNGIHLNEHYFLQTFTEYQIKNRDGMFPYELVAEYGGIKFFCIMEKLPEGVSDVV